MAADFADLRAALRADARAVAEALLGPPSRSASSRSTARWGSKGSLALELRGPKAGLWHDHEAGTGGDLLALIRREQGCDRAGAVRWARAWTGEDAEQLRPRRARPVARPEPADDADTAKQDAARRLWAAAVPVAGTPAERYLKQERGVPCPASGWPLDAMRWHPGVRAWLLAVRDPAGQLVAVQRVFLTSAGGSVRDPAGHKVKRSLGPVSAGVVKLPGRLPVILAEGPETACALWASTGCETWLALGSTGRLTPPAFALLAADDDKRHSPADKARRRALARWRRDGLDVLPVFPWATRRHDGSDFADLIAAEGAAAVQTRIALALDPGASNVRRVPLPIARVRLDRAVRQFAEAVEAGGDAPPVHAARVDLGAGKSFSTRRELAAMVRRLRATNDARTVALAVPTHQLAAEAAAALAERAPDLAVRVWRGRKADAPNRAGPMCQEPERVAEVRRLRLDVDAYACRGCPLAAGCEYRAQHDTRADVWLVPAAMLEQQPPKALGELVALVVDEPPTPAVEHASLPVLDLARYDAIDGDKLAGQRLGSLRRLILDATAELPDGPLPRAAFAATGMTAASATELLALEWRSMIQPTLPANATPAVRAEVLAKAARNVDLGRRTALARALEALLAPDGPELSGLVELRTPKKGPRELMIHIRRDVREAWRALPTLILDATLRLDLVRLTWPTAEVVADLAVEAPHQRVRQVVDGGFTLSALDANAPGLAPEEQRRRERNLARLRVQLHTEARRHTGRVLVVTNKRVRARLEALGMPGNVELVHFNALRGLDRWRDVAALIVVGWTLPPAGALERQAGALTGVAVPATGYQRMDARRELADGTTLMGEAWQHPDPLVEALRWSACEAELIQAIGRGRGVQRTAANPLDVLILGETVLPFAVELVAPAVPSPIDVQLAHGPVAYTEPAHAARAYPSVYRTPSAARMAAERWRTNFYEESLLGECAPPPGTVCVRYQVAGPGHRLAEAQVAQGADGRAEITAALGPLAVFEVLEPPPAAVVLAAQPRRPAFPADFDPLPVHAGAHRPVQAPSTGPPDPGRHPQ